MQHELQLGYRVFLADGADSVGVIRGVSTDTIMVFVENSGDLPVSRNAISSVHSGKVILDRGRLDHAFLKAVDHAHDREDPRLVG
jgi:hypothetical protein